MCYNNQKCQLDFMPQYFCRLQEYGIYPIVIYLKAENWRQLQ